MNGSDSLEKRDATRARISCAFTSRGRRPKIWIGDSSARYVARPWDPPLKTTNSLQSASSDETWKPFVSVPAMWQSRAGIVAHADYL